MKTVEQSERLVEEISAYLSDDVSVGRRYMFALPRGVSPSYRACQLLAQVEARFSRLHSYFISFCGWGEA